MTANETDVPTKNVDPVVGLVYVTTGAPVAELTMILTAVEVAVALRLLVAFAVIEKLPAATLLHAKL